jgi:hypothetical protein
MSFSYGRYRDFGAGGSTNGEATAYAASLPSPAGYDDGDQVYITGGDLAGAIYERQVGNWSYIGVYEAALRMTDPNTGVLPTGFYYRLVNQTDKNLNGIWEWDGFNLVQLTRTE